MVALMLSTMGGRCGAEGCDDSMVTELIHCARRVCFIGRKEGA